MYFEKCRQPSCRLGRRYPGTSIKVQNGQMCSMNGVEKEPSATFMPRFKKTVVKPIFFFPFFPNISNFTTHAQGEVAKDCSGFLIPGLQRCW